jgi:FAD binding domain
VTQPRLKHFGWGREGEGLTPAEDAFVLGRIEQLFGPLAEGKVKPPRLEDIKLAPPRLDPPPSLPFCSTALYDRAAHTYGKSFPDYVRGLVGDYSNAPDAVAYPRTEEEVAAVLDWAGGAQASVTPFGGGSSVVGGVEPHRDAARYKGAVTIDLRELGRVLEVDKTSRAARIEAGAFGPALESQLKPHGLTLRHFPQSFECSTLGGWIATRSGGHFATLYTHIDDLVESLRVITPQGVIETRRLPGSGAGPSPDRLLIGSEGILGIITQGWMRLQDRPKFRGGGAVQFADFFLPLPGLCGRSRKPDYFRRIAVSSTRRRRSTPALRTAVWRSWCWPSNPAITRSNRGWRARSNAAPITAARPSAPIPPTPTAKARLAPGATPSSACPMRASVPLSAASSTTRSRPRSPGTGSSHSTTRSRSRPSARF